MDIPLDFDHLLRTNKDDTSQWDHLIRVSSDTSVASPHFEKILFKSKDSAVGPAEFLGGHYVLSRNPEKPDAKKTWVQIQSILGEKYFAAVKTEKCNIFNLDTEDMEVPELALDQPSFGQTNQQPMTITLDQPILGQTNQQPMTIADDEATSLNFDQATTELMPLRVEAPKHSITEIARIGRNQDRETSPYTQMSFGKHLSELLKQTPSLAVIKEKSSIIHTYYIATTDERFHPKRAVEFLKTSSSSVIPLYRCKVSLLSLSGLYDKIRLANQKPNKFWKPYPKDDSFQLLALSLTRKMSNNTLTTVFCTP